MGFLFLLLLPIFSLILFIIIKVTVPLYQKVQEYLDRLNRQISQNLSGVRVIRAFARKETEQRHVDKASDDLGDIYIRVSNVSALLTPLTTLIMNVGILFLLYFSGLKFLLVPYNKGSFSIDQLYESNDARFNCCF